jgi:uncharacterized membrane protein YvlD (DUF360 family)
VISVGITTSNPYYEDSASESFKANTGLTVMIMMGVTFIPTIALGILTVFQNLIFLAFTPPITMCLAGFFMMVVGTRRLSLPE